MKKLFSVTVAIILTLTLVVASFGFPDNRKATTAQTLVNMIYEKSDSQIIKDLNKADKTQLNDFGISIYTATISKEYRADLKDITKNKVAQPVAESSGKADIYRCIVKKAGTNTFAGEIRFSVENGKVVVHQYSPQTKLSQAMYVKNDAKAIAESIDSVTKAGALQDAKLVYIEGVGYGVLTKVANKQYFTTYGLQTISSPIYKEYDLSQGARAAIDTVSVEHIAESSQNKAQTLPHIEPPFQTLPAPKSK